MNLFYLHAGLMFSGFLLFLSALLVAATQRQKRWWLRAHRTLGITGTTVILCGAVAAIVLSETEGSHFQSPHTWMGLLTITLALATTTLGLLQFRIPQRAASLRPWHRLGGRLLNLIAPITIVMGLRLAGLV